MSQNERLLDYLNAAGRIDPMTAWNELGLYRLGARIWDLRQAGHQIAMKLVDRTNRFGETCKVAEYRLEKDLS